jgi:PAS domain S-box-containing protein
MLKQLSNIFSFQKEKTSITSQKQFDNKLQFSELRYRRLFETAQDGIVIFDANSGKITDVNPSFKDLLGYSDADLIGKQLWESGIMKDIVHSKKVFLELQMKGYILYKDLTLQTKDGKSIAVEFVGNVYMVDNQKVVQCNIRDITSRKKTEEAIEKRTKELESITKSQEETKKAMLNVMEDLEDAKNQLELEKAKDEAILSNIGDGLIAVDNQGKIIIMNKVAEEMLGWKLKELINKAITNLPLEDETGNLIPINKRPTSLALYSSKTIKVTYFFVRKDKTKFPLTITATPIKLGGKVIGLVELLRDITQEAEIDRAKSEFVSLASHQLRTPLGIIKWYLEALRNNDFFHKAPPAIRKYLDEIYKSNERVLNLVRDLLSASRIDQKRIKNVPESVDLLQFVNEIVEQMQIVAHKKRVALRLIIHNHKKTLVNIDPLRLHEVIENLIANAIEYSTTAGSVEVTVKKVDDIFSISVKDTGIGISLPDQKRLFTKFFRSEKAVIHNPEGSGLGLYVVKSYVEDWGGKISVESNEGKGSIFTIHLPISKHAIINKESK